MKASSRGAFWCRSGSSRPSPCIRGGTPSTAVVKQRLLRALYTAGIPLSKIASAKLVYPEDGPTGPYYHRHADPVILVWWAVDELAPLAARAIARYQMGPRQARALS